MQLSVVFNQDSGVEFYFIEDVDGSVFQNFELLVGKDVYL
jgi:hypothetical protein